jgi:hypothetical protein
MDTFSMVRGIQARRIAAQAEAERDCAVTAPPLLPLVDARPVRGVVTLQARPLLRSTDRPMSVLLVVNRSMLVVQTLQKPYRDLLELQLQDLTAHVEPNHDNMFLITVKSKQRDASAIDSNGIVVALRSCSLRDQWLQALVTARVDVTGCWQPSADMTAIRPTDSLCHGSWSDAPVRWLR